MPSQNEVKVLIFDFDGVIVESNNIKDQAFEIIFKKPKTMSSNLLSQRVVRMAESETLKMSQMARELKAKGHEVHELPAWGHGSSSQLLEVLPQGTFAIGSDPRCEGHAAGV